MSEHDEHSDKGHPIGAVIMVLIIVGLVTWLFSLAAGMNNALMTVPFTLGVGLYAVFGLARGSSNEH